MKTLRDLLLRVQRDAAFARLVSTAPDAAAADYELSSEELEALRRLDRSLYRYLVPAHRLQEQGAGYDPHPPPPPEDPPPLFPPVVTAPLNDPPEWPPMEFEPPPPEGPPPEGPPPEGPPPEGPPPEGPPPEGPPPEGPPPEGPPEDARPRAGEGVRLDDVRRQALLDGIRVSRGVERRAMLEELLEYVR
jgi:hypothetical protein